MNPSDIFNRNDRPMDENQIYTVNGRPSFRIQRRPQANCGIFPLGSDEEMTPLLHDMSSSLHDSSHESSLRGYHHHQPEELTVRGEAPEHDVSSLAQETSLEQDDASQADAEAAMHAEPLPEPSTPPTYVGWSAARSPAGVPQQDAGDNATVRHVRGMSTSTPDVGHRTPMYQYRGSNIQRNPLTGSGIAEPVPKSGKRMVNKFGYRIID